MRGALEGVRVVMERESSLKFTKYDCANQPKIFLANNFEKSPTNRDGNKRHHLKTDVERFKNL